MFAAKNGEEMIKLLKALFTRRDIEHEYQHAYDVRVDLLKKIDTFIPT